MELFYSLCLGLLVSISSFSQYQIELKPKVFYTDSVLFYVQNVVDSSGTEMLGQVNNLKLYLKPSKAKSMYSFLSKSFPIQDGVIPIVIRINELSIQKEQTDVSDITARVCMNLTFFDTSKQVLFRVSHIEDEVFDEFSEDEILQTHEKRVRAGFEYCMRSFIDQLNHPELDWAADFENKTMVNSRLEKWHNMLSFKKVYSNHTEGWRISYTGFADRNDDFILPFVFSYDQVRLKNDVLKKSKIKSVDTYAFGTGFNGYLKIVNGFYLGAGLDVPIGAEVIRDLEDQKKTNFLIGVNVKEGMLIMPWQDFGILMGFNFFQSFRNSKVYQTNYGFEWEIGINF
jgi:hypothetical protein